MTPFSLAPQPQRVVACADRSDQPQSRVRSGRWRAASLAGEVDNKYDPEVIAYLYSGVGNFIGMRWADWTGSQVPADVLEELLNVLAHGLPQYRASTG